MKNLKSSPEANGGLRGSQSMVHLTQNFPNFSKNWVLSGPEAAQSPYQIWSVLNSPLFVFFDQKYMFLGVFESFQTPIDHKL